MAEGAAAFAIAGNVLQFVEFATKFGNKCREIHRAGGSAPGDLQSLRYLVESQQAALERLQIPESERSLLLLQHPEVTEVANACTRHFAEIKNSLDRIGITDNKTARGVVVNAFKATWNRDKIESLRSEVASLNQNLNTALLNSLRDYATKSEGQQIAILERLDIIQEESTGAFKSTSLNEGEDTAWYAPGDAVIAFIVRSLDAEPEERQKSAVELRRGVLQRIHLTTASVNYDGDGDRPPITLSRNREMRLRAVFLASFAYKVMDDRHSRIIEAHQETFRWIFEHPSAGSEKWSNFKDWLKSDSKLYWITGKAGSGKSTLMKFICSPVSEYHSQNTTDTPVSRGARFERCRNDLMEWAGSRPLIIASFYFWASGNELEASPKGLYMSLIFQILQHCPEIIPRVAPVTWEAMSLFNEKPSRLTEAELEAMIRLVVTEAQKERNLCLFIDGLDEFSGDLEKLIALIEVFLQCPNVKVCVSSRPWVVFEEAFQHRPSLKLEDLTYNDIRKFIAKRFSEEEGFRRLSIREPEYAEQLEDNIATKAVGVFLWVSLVVKSLLSGMENDDRVSDMQRRLDLLPPELENLYNAILNSLDPFYFQHAAQYFRLLEAWKISPPVILFGFADEEIENLTKLPIREYSKAELRERTETMRRRINSRCLGLLEVAVPPSSSYGSVQYLHKTVRDFTLRPKVNTKIRDATSGFDCHIRMCFAYLLGFQNSRIEDRNESLQDDKYLELLKEHRLQAMRVFVSRCLKAASEVKPENVQIMINLLDSLCEASTRVFGSDEVVRANFLRSVKDTDFPLNEKHENAKGSSFLSLTVRLGVREYVKNKMHFGCLEPRLSEEPIDSFGRFKLSRIKNLLRGSKSRNTIYPSTDEHHLHWPLLMDALYRNSISEIRLDMVRLCLENGADPNFQLRSDGSTIWSRWVDRLLIAGYGSENQTRAKNLEILRPYWPITKLLSDHGATLTLRSITKSSADPSYGKLLYEIVSRREV
ncbi:uncharacterized protein CCOS01_09179 [Colletotrichum costaricense]|uniref:NACHT domain-containing protein n=3 Tax=Colletotrichum acutatum species complex TaxID=2707335 RepID=A0AAI9YUX0_9PEZI|nr:uncharacterized protein CCOS01_09179 [Colletotrichum costaricense]XP_060384409.1 uncharacterized protein CTAM01_05010 [Colletotrichum tamarilloi]KAK1503021.1 hypothetical protein CTAM01_05010 [Colletotrichum tamarilloi]KAK1524092.1 hypothetical protein CCOS01_09179 [Colletotrichum costaricense]